MQVQVDPTEDTEWNDILREKGIIPERPKSPTDELDELLQEAVEKAHNERLEHKTIDELDELEDEEDEDFLNSYKQKRFKEMQLLASKSKFGQVYPVAKPEYQQEITDASKDGTFVIVHLSLNAKLQSRLLADLFIQAATKFKEIKFTEIQGSRAIENYPESNCPTLLVYHNGQVLKQLITLVELGGNATTLKDLEKLLVDVGAVDHSDKRLTVNQDDEDLQEAHKLRFVKKTIRDANVNQNYKDDDDDDFFD